MQDTEPPVDEPDIAHQAPTITRLGTLSELTLGLGPNTDDGVGGVNGDHGSL